MLNLCPPALIYVIFSISQIIIDIYYKLYNTAFLKFVVAILVTFLLNALCKQGLGVISWIIVFIPFILMTFVVAMLLYIFGLNATTGSKTDTSIDTSIDTDVILPPNSSSSPAYESFINI
jgi:hypothetical protein